MYIQPFDIPTSRTENWRGKVKRKTIAGAVDVDIEKEFPASEGWRIVSHSIVDENTIPLEGGGVIQEGLYLTVLVEKIVEA